MKIQQDLSGRDEDGIGYGINDGELFREQCYPTRSPPAPCTSDMHIHTRVYVREVPSIQRSNRCTVGPFPSAGNAFPVGRVSILENGTLLPCENQVERVERWKRSCEKIDSSYRYLILYASGMFCWEFEKGILEGGRGMKMF